MDDLAQRLSHASARLDPGWTEGQVASSFSRLESRLRRRRLARRGATVAAVTLIVGAMAWLAATGPLRSDATTSRVVHHTEPSPPTDHRSQSATPAPIRLSDGSTATPSSAATEVVTVAVEPETVTLQLYSGSARFDVTRNPNRTFTVVAGQVSIVVIGTSFTVTRSVEQVEVAVHTGRVRVEWDDDHQELWAGGRGVFPPPPAPPFGLQPEGRRRLVEGDSATSHQALMSETEQRSGVHRSLGEGDRPSRSEGHERTSWRALAERGDFAEAFDAMQGETVGNDVEALLLAADVARYAGHPAQAVGYLRRVVESHREDPRAPLAAFTLGRALLNQLGSPREAAEAFALSQTLSPFGSLAEDALAREVEAWSRAGIAVRARERAERYQDLFPEGRRLRAVRHHGGLE